MKRIAMWSGPRNISTAMMRAWGNRPDTAVCDEPLYAHYLLATGKSHPGADEVIARYQTDWRPVVDGLTDGAPLERVICYQKHMAHHLLPHIDRLWLRRVTNCFLIRHPQEVITSYLAKYDMPTIEDLGFVQQVEIFDFVRAQGGHVPPVVDAKDVQNNPRRMLGLLCEALDVPFDEAMLSWPPGFRDTDGVWAKHWYTEVTTSTSFRPYKPKPANVPESMQGIYRRCLECYEMLYEYRLR